jgi:glycosyltransferase involved in cell wall biosynthesis
LRAANTPSASLDMADGWRHDRSGMQQPTIDPELARRCVIDVTTALQRRRDGLDGMRRVELECARALLAAGGRAAALDEGSKPLRAIGSDVLAALLGDTPPMPSQKAPAIARALRAIGDRLRPRSELAVFPALAPHPGDVLLLFGEYWRPQLVDSIRAIHRSQTMRIMPLVHDLMPVRRPELFWDDRPGCDTANFLRLYRQSVRTLVETSGRILTNSEFSRADLLRLCEEQGWPPPAIGVAPLASDLDCAVAPVLTPRLREKALAEGAFALMVSQIDPRKNHLFAYQLWRRLVERLGARTMPLVLAGRRGWQSADLLLRLEHDAAMWGRHLHFIEAPSDGELAWLYSGAAFSIFPSELEGWGLPITESLAFGTPCLAADNSSLREASQGLAWHADTLDGVAWAREVERCMTEPAHLVAARATIKRKFVTRRWADFLADVLREVRKVSEPAG